MITIGTVGGIFLIIGAFFTYRGEIFYAVMSYLFADTAWIYLSFERGDTQGAIFVIIGAVLGLLAFFKMRNGKMRKDLHLKESDEVLSNV